VTSLVQQA